MLCQIYVAPQCAPYTPTQTLVRCIVESVLRCINYVCVIALIPDQDRPIKVFQFWTGGSQTQTR